MGTFGELAVVILIAAILGIIARFLKQPIILAFLITGIIIGALGFLNLNDRDTWKIFADLGIMFLLFLVGLEVNLESLRLVGKHAFFIGGGQIIITTIFGFLIARAFDFSYTSSLYIAAALTFSSTVIVVKLLSEKRDLASHYGKLALGILLVQDVVVILLLVMLSGLVEGGRTLFEDVSLTLIKGMGLFIVMFLLGRHIIPKLFDNIASAQDLVFVVSLAWTFLIVMVVQDFGFSIEIGGFLAGISLANSSERWEIAGRLKPLRDFFMLIFFALLGSTLAFSTFNGIGFPLIIFSLFVLIGNPLIVIGLMGLFGYRKRTSFLTGLTMGQISEFSFVLSALGLSLGHITENEVALISGVALITITVSTYLIINGDAIYRTLTPFLRIFEREGINGEIKLTIKNLAPRVLIIGAGRVGQNILATLPKKDVLIIEFDPDVAAHLNRCGYNYIFDDITNPDLFENIRMHDILFVISTIPGYYENMKLLEQIKSFTKRAKSPKVILRAENENEAQLFYRHGASYVILPYLTSGHYLGKAIARSTTPQFLENLKHRDLMLMEKEVCWVLK